MVYILPSTKLTFDPLVVSFLKLVLRSRYLAAAYREVQHNHNIAKLTKSSDIAKEDASCFRKRFVNLRYIIITFQSKVKP